MPFWLQPVKHYVGAAWYQREVEIPAAWQGRRLVLTLERPHIETRVWLDDRPIGKQDSLSTPHEYDLGTTVCPGRHRLTIRVDNRLVVDVGVNSHSVSDHTQGNWNGIAGRIELAATPPVWVADLQVFPHVATRSVTVKGRIGNATGRPGQGVLEARDRRAREGRRPGARSRPGFRGRSRGGRSPRRSARRRCAALGRVPSRALSPDRDARRTMRRAAGP